MSLPPESIFNQTQRLLPSTLEDRLIAWAHRCAGYLLLFVVGTTWLSLLSWAVSDPSLTHATSGLTRNWMGPLGAILSDLLLQLLGFAAALSLMAPMFWGVELAYGERIWNFRVKAAFYPISVVAMAGLLSSLPSGGGWPLHHGLGGILGDAVAKLGTSAFALLNPERAALAAAVLFLFSGLSALLKSIGIELRDVGTALKGLGTLNAVAGGTSWQQNLQAEAQGLRERLFAGAGLGGVRRDRRVPDPTARPEPVLSPGLDVSTPGTVDTPYAADDSWRPSSAPPRAAGHKAPWSDYSPAFEADASDLEPTAEPPYGVAASSRAMAARFAPLSSSPVAAPRPVAPRGGLLKGFQLRRPEPQYRRPPLSLLKRAAAAGKSGAEFSQTALRGNARLLEDVLADFGVKGEIRDVKPGPVVTLFEFEPARGTKSSRIIALAEDIARSMSVASARVAVVPGRNVIGIELPNVRREPVLLREILESDAFASTEAALPLALGKSIGGDAVVADLARMPHLLVAGTTGSGKSVGVNAMIISLLYRHGPEDVRFLMIDPKMLELSVYNGIPHLLAPVVTDPAKAVSALNWVVGEMEERYKRMSKLSVRNIETYNAKARSARSLGEPVARTVQTGFDAVSGAARYERQELELEPMPYIVVVVDEFADLMIVAGKEIESAVQRLAQMARAAGIHLIMATQRPSVDIITGTIKANFPTRVSFRVTSKIDSRTILNEQGAEQLLGSGDMLYAGGSGQPVRVHGPFVADEEVENIAAALRQQGEPVYVDSIMESAVAQTGGFGDLRADGEADLYDRAVAVVLRDQKASTSYLQRRLSIGYNRAADLIERMEREGLIGAANHAGKREILTPAGQLGPDGA